MQLTYEEILESLTLVSDWFINKALTFVSVLSKVPIFSTALFISVSIPSLLIVFDLIFGINFSFDSFLSNSFSLSKKIRNKYLNNKEEQERKQFQLNKHRKIYTPQYMNYLKSLQGDFTNHKQGRYIPRNKQGKKVDIDVNSD